MDISELLIIGIMILLFVIVLLILLYWFASIKNKSKSSGTKLNKNTGNTQSSNTKQSSQYTKIPVFEFMEFDSIEDNMIIQDGGKRYLMVIECEGINYDLMSELEQNSVEAGFVQFLNTLRHPIQIYTQTRTINIGNSIERYKARIAEIQSDLNQNQIQLNKAIQSDDRNSEQVKKLKLEVARSQNLYDYGKDIVSSIEKMSLNKNVLRKHYYIIVPYYTSELGVAELEEEEKKNMIFSELYTRCQAMTRTLFACSMKSRILDSNEIVELLYVAYNRDESEVFTVEKAIKSGYAELYSTAPDVLDKRMEAIQREIERKSLELAKNTVDEINSEKQLKVEKKEKNMDELIRNLAKAIITENKKFIGNDTSEQAIKKIEGSTKEGGENNEKIKETRTRRTTKSN